MKIVECCESKFANDFFPIIIDLWYADKYDPHNRQHAECVKRKMHAAFVDFGVALCAYTDEDEPIGFILYKHDPGLENVRFTGKDAHIIQFGLFDKFQRQGIGTKLLDEASHRIRNAGGECLYTDTYTKNDDSMMFYIKRKFIPVALPPGLNGLDDEGQVFLYKKL